MPEMERSYVILFFKKKSSLQEEINAAIDFF